jgi:hypothetical protein
MEAGAGGSNHQDSSTTKAARHYSILSTAATGTDQNLQDLWHCTNPQAPILESHAAKRIGGPELHAIPAPTLPPFDAIALATLALSGPDNAF